MHLDTVKAHFVPKQKTSYSQKQEIYIEKTYLKIYKEN